MEIRRLVSDPAQETPDVRARLQDIQIREIRGEVAVRHTGVDDPMANRMHWHNLGTAAAFWDTVMPFDFSTQRAVAERAVFGVSGGDR